MSVKTLPKVFPARLKHLDRTKEMQWLREHRQQYLGQWVLLWGDQLIASGKDPKPLVAEARANGYDRPLIVHVTEPIDMGGWS